MLGRLHLDRRDVPNAPDPAIVHRMRIRFTRPSRFVAQSPPGTPGGAHGGLAGGAPRAAMVNIDNMLPVIVVRQVPAPRTRSQTRMLNRLRSSYAQLPQSQ